MSTKQSGQYTEAGSIASILRSCLWCLQTAQAFRAVTRCKVTVIAPMPDINTWTEGDECFVNPGHGRSGPTPPGQASMMREAMQRDNSTQPVDVPGAACVHTSLPGGEERMQVVFDERACAQNSDEHMAVLAERCAVSNYVLCYRSKNTCKRIFVALYIESAACIHAWKLSASSATGRIQCPCKRTAPAVYIVVGILVFVLCFTASLLLCICGFLWMFEQCLVQVVWQESTSKMNREPERFCQRAGLLHRTTVLWQCPQVASSSTHWRG